MTCRTEWSEKHEGTLLCIQIVIYSWLLSFITHALCTHVATGQLYKARDEEKRSADMWAEHNRTLDLAEQQQWARKMSS